MSTPPFILSGDLEQAEIFFTAEHASNKLPEPLEWKPEEAFIKDTHWALDIGIQDLIDQMLPNLSCAAITSTHTRLFCDLNRDPARSDLIREYVDDCQLSFNHNLSTADRKSRIKTCHQGYHDGLDRYLTARRSTTLPKILISLHSFTPIWNNKLRTMDIGVLFCEQSPLVDLFYNSWKKQGYFVARNEPYTGVSGLMYSVHRHGIQHQIPYIELEYNQSLLCSADRIAKVAKDTVDVINRIYEFL